MPAITPRRRRDAGQAFPLYIVAVAGLLFLALAFFAVGQAAATRNGAQTAADAAALAAGQKYRDLLTKSFLDGLRDGSYESNRAVWKDLLNGRGVLSDEACERASWFAGRNGAYLSGSGSGCTPGSWPTSFAVAVKTRNSVGNSVIPATKDAHGEAEAKSVVEPRCTLDPAKDGTGGTGDTGATGGTGAPDGKSDEGDKGGTDGKGGKGGKDKDAPKGAPLGITCDGKPWTLDPDDLGHLPGASDLFSVRLAH